MKYDTVPCLWLKSADLHWKDRMNPMKKKNIPKYQENAGVYLLSFSGPKRIGKNDSTQHVSEGFFLSLYKCLKNLGRILYFG